MISKDIFENYEIEAVLAHFDVINKFNDLHNSLYDLMAEDFGSEENADFFNNHINEMKLIAETIDQAIIQIFKMVKEDSRPYLHKDDSGQLTDSVLGVIVYYMMVFSNVINHLKCNTDKITYSRIYEDNEETINEVIEELKDIDNKLDKVLCRYI